MSLARTRLAVGHLQVVFASIASLEDTPPLLGRSILWFVRVVLREATQVSMVSHRAQIAWPELIPPALARRRLACV